MAVVLRSGRGRYSPGRRLSSFSAARCSGQKGCPLVTGERLMQQSNSRRVITRDKYDAVLLDLDGVITDTASLHAACWKQMLDEYLQKRASERGEAFRPFDLVTDYRLYLDGKPRFDGVRDFLASRGIKLPEGDSDDPPQAETVRGLGNRKNELVTNAIERIGVEA